MGLLEREHATILNTAILAFARRTIASFQRAKARLSLRCPLFLTQNDGTLITATRAAQFPIRTFASGATNSMRGAAYLAGLHAEPGSEGKTAIVCDIGGTTTDVGVLLPSGFPRQAAAFTKSAEFVRSNFAVSCDTALYDGKAEFKYLAPALPCLMCKASALVAVRT